MRKGNSSQQDSHFGVAMRRLDEAEAISLMESLRERRGVAPSIDAPLAAGAAWGGSPDFSAGGVMSASVNRMKSTAQEQIIYWKLSCCVLCDHSRRRGRGVQVRLLAQLSTFS